MARPDASTATCGLKSGRVSWVTAIGWPQARPSNSRRRISPACGRGKAESSATQASAISPAGPSASAGEAFRLAFSTKTVVVKSPRADTCMVGCKPWHILFLLLRSSANIRLDILVQVEQVIGIILRLERHQPLIIRSIRGADPRGSIVAEKVDV